ncbi:MAG TPA: hypothetical protein VGC76_10305 [Pyrinomonadaceae bacterium]|jgi:hypothetical protein
MRERQKYSSGVKWESIVGYSRAVRVGTRIYVTSDDGEIVGAGESKTIRWSLFLKTQN